ncbi:hypothetical protein JCM5350_007929 [Sporobolomyces pararoseus]
MDPSKELLNCVIGSKTPSPQPPSHGAPSPAPGADSHADKRRNTSVEIDRNGERDNVGAGGASSAVASTSLPGNLVGRPTKDAQVQAVASLPVLPTVSAATQTVIDASASAASASVAGLSATSDAQVASAGGGAVGGGSGGSGGGGAVASSSRRTTGNVIQPMIRADDLVRAYLRPSATLAPSLDLTSIPLLYQSMRAHQAHIDGGNERRGKKAADSTYGSEGHRIFGVIVGVRSHPPQVKTDSQTHQTTTTYHVDADIHFGQHDPQGRLGLLSIFTTDKVKYDLVVEGAVYFHVPHNRNPPNDSKMVVRLDKSQELKRVSPDGKERLRILCTAFCRAWSIVPPDADVDAWHDPDPTIASDLDKYTTKQKKQIKTMIRHFRNFYRLNTHTLNHSYYAPLDLEHHSTDEPGF